MMLNENIILTCKLYSKQAKHEPTCLKNSKTKRKVFDSTKQRVEGTDLNLRQVKKAQKKVGQLLMNVEHYVPYSSSWIVGSSITGPSVVIHRSLLDDIG